MWICTAVLPAYVIEKTEKNTGRRNPGAKSYRKTGDLVAKSSGRFQIIGFIHTKFSLSLYPITPSLLPLHERSSFHSSAVRKREKQAREPEQKMFRLPSFVYETRLGSYCPSVPYSLFIYRERGKQGFDEHESLWKGWVWRKVFPSLFPNLRPIFLQTSIPACRRPLRARPQ